MTVKKILEEAASEVAEQHNRNVMRIQSKMYKRQMGWPPGRTFLSEEEDVALRIINRLSNDDLHNLLKFAGVVPLSARDGMVRQLVIVLKGGRV
jgi:hypothetical protein